MILWVNAKKTSILWVNAKKNDFVG